MTVSRILLAGCCAAVLLIGDARAQTDAGKIETVTVTAQKRSEDVQAVPVAVQAFTAKQLNDLGIKASTDLSQFAPNVDIALPAGAGNQPIIAIRGVGLNDYDTNNAGPNGIYFDEVYLSSPASQTFQAFDLQRIEILKGPQGTLYGRNTSGGAINFISNKPSDEFTGDFHGEFGSFDTYQLEGGVGGPLADGLDFRVAMVKNGSAGYTRNALTGNLENGANNAAGRAMLQWKPNDSFSLLWTLRGAIVANRPAEYRHLGAYDPNNGGAFCSVAQVYEANTPCVDLFGYGTPTNFYAGAYNRLQHLQVHNWGTSLHAEANVGDLVVTSITSFDHNDKLHPEDSDASPNQELEINFGVRSATVTQEFRVSRDAERYHWQLGAYYLYEDLHQNQPLFILLDADNFFGGPGTGDGVAEIAYDKSAQVTDSYALYGQGTFDITDKLAFTVGLRGTKEHKGFDYAAGFQFQDGGMGHFDPITVLTPPPPPLPGFDRSLNDAGLNYRLGLDYHFTDDVMTYASIATGFKSGGFNGSFLASDPVLISAQLSPIKPEHVTAYEIGIKSLWLDGRLKFNAALFYNSYNDLQIFVLSPVPGTNLATNILANAAHAHMTGADIEAEARPIDNLSFKADLGLLQAKVDSNELLGTSVYTGLQIFDYGKQLPLSPHVSFSSNADYRVPLGENHLDFQMSASYKSHQFFDIANSAYLTQKPYWIENARIAYAFNDDKWEVAGFVRNLSGQKYFLDVFDLSFLGFYQGIMGAPRTFGGELNYRF